MKTQLMTEMMTSISEVMETMFFLPVASGQTAVLSRTGLDDKDTLACRLAFSGDICGHVILAAPDPLIREMAENFMGEPRDQLTQDHLTGTLMELLNMVCGNALRYTPAKTPFELGIPEMIDPTVIAADSRFHIIETDMSKLGMLLQTE
ncbi:MAG: chemotaxis protein CheX [Desulfobacteraceae bacterium]|nr:chemotaxis protein CheX [Desulfobacteraceae bacterium]